MNEDYTIVGIDFGTSTTVVRVRNYYVDGRSVQTKALLDDFNGRDNFATVILERKNGVRKYGHEADEASGRRLDDGDVVHRNFKVDLISPDVGRRDRAKALTREFLSFVCQKLEGQRYNLELLNTVVAVVSVPAKWPKDVRDFMRSVVVEAGFVADASQVRIVDEPTAASRATLTSHLPDLMKDRVVGLGRYNVMMVDMGAGTTDLAVFKLQIGEQGDMQVDSIVTFPTVDNPNLCGGREIDACLCAHACDAGGEFAVKNRRQVEYIVKKFKENLLSPQLRNNERCLWKDEFFFDRDEFSRLNDIDRKVFEDLTKRHWRDWWNVVGGALSAAHRMIDVGPEDIDLLILTGGHSFWYCAEELFLGKSLGGIAPLPFAKLQAEPCRILTESNRSATVALGLALADAVLPFVPTSTNGYALKLSIPGCEASQMRTIVEPNEELPVSRMLEYTLDLAGGEMRSMVPVRVELYCGNQSKSMRLAARTDVEVKTPEHFDPNLPLRMMAVLDANVDVDYGLSAEGAVTALYVENGTLSGNFNVTNIKVNI